MHLCFKRAKRAFCARCPVVFHIAATFSVYVMSGITRNRALLLGALRDCAVFSWLVRSDRAGGASMVVDDRTQAEAHVTSSRTPNWVVLLDEAIAIEFPCCLVS